MTMKKKIISVVLVISLLAIAVAGSTLAYFTDNDEKTNTFTVGNVDITLTEPNWDAQGKEEAKDMYPGEAVAKDPTVKNVGANPAFVRIKVEWPEGVSMSYRTDYVDNKLGENWKYNEADGYFYYTKVLEKDVTTDALFDQVVLSTDTTNAASTTSEGTQIEYNIIVSAEAVQAQGARPSWSAVEAMTVDEIAAWFTTVMGE